MFDGHQRNKPRSSQSESSIQVQPSGKAEKYGQRRAAVSLKVDERVLKQWPGKSNDQQQISVTKKGTTRQLRSSSSSSAKVCLALFPTIPLLFKLIFLFVLLLGVTPIKCNHSVDYFGF